MRLEQIMERLRASGMAPRFSAPIDTEPPAPLKSPPSPPVRIVGRRRVEGGGDGR